MFLGIFLLILFSAICFFGARCFFMTRQTNKEKYRTDRTYLIKTFWYAGLTAVLLATVCLIRLIMNHFGVIPGGYSDFSVSWIWALAASAYAWEAYSLNERIKKIPKK